MIISRAPMRISFFGGGTDFPEYFREHRGAVLSTAIDKYTYLTAGRFYSHLFGYALRLSYSKGELVDSLEHVQHAVFRECLRHCGLERDIELHTVADLPSFTGLGTSSSFTVALLMALNAHKGVYLSGLNLAYEAIHIERTVLGECVGVQDQVISAVGGFNVFEFRAEDDIRVHPVPLSPRRLKELEAHLLLIFTDIKRRAADVEKQKVSGFSSNLDNLAAMRKMVDRGYDLLIANDSLEQFGYLLNEAWQMKRRLSTGVSNLEIETMYEAGLAAGAWGGKLLGAGGGGFLLFCAPPETHQNILDSLRGKHQVKVSLSAPGATIIYANES
jgi:D-glycero-alpha-D-manno-heptose-7-phosphate kinase